MKFKKIEELKGDYLLVYFVDAQQRRQGTLHCYKTMGKHPSQENLLFMEEYKDNLLLDKRWMQLPSLLTAADLYTQ